MQKNDKFNITIIGAGNVATVFASKFIEAGHHIDAIWSRNTEHAAILANQCRAKILKSLSELPATSDVVLIAIKDESIQEVVEKISNCNAVLLHTAGSVEMKVLSAASSRIGVFYPLQSIRKEMPVSENIPLLVDGSSTDVLQLIKNLAYSVSNLVKVSGDEERLKLHLAAVFVSNFTNHLYQLTHEWCEKEKLSFDLLLPLIREVANRQTGESPSNWQTGPASRGDLQTIDKHLALLEGNPFIQQLYKMMSEDLLARKKKKDELRSHNTLS
jgi:predicted short-subunit dehydrogenase-like oxidoreductase (DUF2520 family)